MNISRRLNIVTISNPKEIKFVLDNSRKIYFKYGILFLNKDNSVKEKLRVAIIVKKNCGNSVRRNYIKRIGRYFLRENITLFSKYNRVIFLFLSKEKFKYKNFEENLMQVLLK